jgi:hypothetical protein
MGVSPMRVDWNWKLYLLAAAPTEPLQPIVSFGLTARMGETPMPRPERPRSSTPIKDDD